MEKKSLKVSQVRKIFKAPEDLKIQRRVIKNDKIPVGCRTFGMVLESEKDPCSDPRCEVCRRRIAKNIENDQEELLWQKRRESREQKGYFFGEFETLEELLEKEGPENGMYSFVAEGEDAIQYIYSQGEWVKKKEIKE